MDEYVASLSALACLIPHPTAEEIYEDVLRVYEIILLLHRWSDAEGDEKRQLEEEIRERVDIEIKGDFWTSVVVYALVILDMDLRDIISLLNTLGLLGRPIKAVEVSPAIHT